MVAQHPRWVIASIPLHLTPIYISHCSLPHVVRWEVARWRCTRHFDCICGTAAFIIRCCSDPQITNYHGADHARIAKTEQYKYPRNIHSQCSRPYMISLCFSCHFGRLGEFWSHDETGEVARWSWHPFGKNLSSEASDRLTCCCGRISEIVPSDRRRARNPLCEVISQMDSCSHYHTIRVRFQSCVLKPCEKALLELYFFDLLTFRFPVLRDLSARFCQIRVGEKFKSRYLPWH